MSDRQIDRLIESQKISLNSHQVYQMIHLFTKNWIPYYTVDRGLNV